MNLESAYQLLGLLPGASEADRFAAYESTRHSLENKLAKAPTPGLREKYRGALAQLDEAIEAIENSADGGELPTLSATPQPVPPPAPPPLPPAPRHTHSPARPTPAPATKSRAGEVAGLLVLVAIAVAGGAWYMQKQKASDAAKDAVTRGMPPLKAQIEESVKAAWEHLRALKASGGGEKSPFGTDDPNQIGAELRTEFLAAERAQQNEDWATAEKHMRAAAKALAEFRTKLGGSSKGLAQTTRAAEDAQRERLEAAVENVSQSLRSCDIEKVKLALDTPGFDVNRTNREGLTLLHEMVSFWGAGRVSAWKYPRDKQKQMASLLLRHPRIDVMTRGPSGFTPLHGVASNRGASAVWLLRELLRHRGADVNARADDGMTPLMVACDAKVMGTFRVLLNHPGVDINARDNQGLSALAHAKKEPPFDPFAMSSGPDGEREFRGQAQPNPEMIRALESRGAR